MIDNTGGIGTQQRHRSHREGLVIAWLAKARGEALMQASINYVFYSNGIPSVYYLLTGL